MPKRTGIVGREVELEAIDRLLDAVAKGAPVAVQLLGEPGIGKSTLLEALADRAEDRHHLVLAGRATEFEGDVPLGVFVDALDAYVGTLDRHDVRALGPEDSAELAALLPSFAGAPGGSAVRMGEDRHRSQRAMRALLERLAARHGLVLVLDDVHWADSASLELLAHVLRRRPQAGILVAVAFRPAQASDTLLRLLDRLREPADERLELGPLTRAQADALLDPATPAELRDELFRQSGGNPFFLTELARSPVEPSAPAARQTGEVPDVVRRALEHELSLTGPHARRVAKAAAVIGEPFAPELLAAAAELGEPEVLSALDELVGLDLVRPTDAPRDFRFRHPLVRRAIYEGAAPAWRLGAHERVATALTDAGAPPARRAPHVERSARPGDESAIALLSEAGHATAAIAPAIAARWFEAALRLLSDDAGTRRLELLVPMATALGACGRLVESRDALARVLEALPGDMAAVRIPVMAFIAQIEHLLGRHETATGILRGALDELPPDAGRDAVALQVELATDCFYLNDYLGMHEWASRASAAGQAVGDAVLLATATAQLALAGYNLGRFDEAETAYRCAVELVARLDDGELAAQLMSLFWLGWYGQSMDHFEEGIAFLDRGLAISRATGQGYLLVPKLIGKSILLAWLGRLAEASALADEALEIARLSGNAQYLTWALTLRCWISVNLGELAGALAAGEEGVEQARLTGDNYFTALSGCYLAEARLEAGEPERCREEMLAAVGGAGFEPVERPFRSHFYEILTRAELAIGDLEAAGRWAELAEAACESVPIPTRRAEAMRARSVVLLQAGDGEDAARLAGEAAALASRSGARLEAARGRALAGRALLLAGSKAAGADELVAAVEEMTACGAARMRDAAAGELRRAGRRTPPRRAPAESAPGGLSRRQHEIALLVAAGKTNRQIAAELFLSERTVETHLANVFGKLGVRSRAAVAAAVARTRADAP